MNDFKKNHMRNKTVKSLKFKKRKFELKCMMGN